MLFIYVYIIRKIILSILFCAIFYGVSFGIKKGEFMQNPVNTPEKIGEPYKLSNNIAIKKSDNYLSD